MLQFGPGMVASPVQFVDNRRLPIKVRGLHSVLTLVLVWDWFLWGGGERRVVG